MSTNFVFFRFYSAEISCALNFLHERGEEAEYCPGQIIIELLFTARAFSEHK